MNKRRIIAFYAIMIVWVSLQVLLLYSCRLNAESENTQEELFNVGLTKPNKIKQNIIVVQFNKSIEPTLLSKIMAENSMEINYSHVVYKSYDKNKIDISISNIDMSFALRFNVKLLNIDDYNRLTKNLIDNYYENIVYTSPLFIDQNGGRQELYITNEIGVLFDNTLTEQEINEIQKEYHLDKFWSSTNQGGYYYTSEKDYISQQLLIDRLQSDKRVSYASFCQRFINVFDFEKEKKKDSLY